MLELPEHEVIWLRSEHTGFLDFTVVSALKLIESYPHARKGQRRQGEPGL